MTYIALGWHRKDLKQEHLENIFILYVQHAYERPEVSVLEDVSCLGSDIVSAATSLEYHLETMQRSGYCDMRLRSRWDESKLMLHDGAQGLRIWFSINQRAGTDPPEAAIRASEAFDASVKKYFDGLEREK
jgi:hypothetical protein